METPLIYPYDKGMFQTKFLLATGVLLLVSLPTASAQTAANDNSSTGVSGACQSQKAETNGACDKYLNSSLRGGSAKKRKSTSVSGGIDEIDKDLSEEVEQSGEDSQKCIQAAKSCAQACRGNLEEKTIAGNCNDKSAGAKSKHREFAAASKKSVEEYKEAKNQMSGRKNDDKGDKDDKDNDRRGSGHGHARKDSDGDGIPDYRDKTPGNVLNSVHNHLNDNNDRNDKNDRTPSPQSAGNSDKDKPSQSEKTPEQAKEERREKKREERREERMSALGSAFMNLNPAKTQAIGESAMAPASAQTQAGGAANGPAGALAGAVDGTDKSKTGKPAASEDDDDSRAGFNALAQKNLESRKALARAMGINSKSLPPVSALPAMGPSGSGSAMGLAGASTFGGGSPFNYSAEAITLDPVTNTERPSNLPQNFKLGAPSGGGGGGGGRGGSEGTSVAGMNTRKQARRAPANEAPERDEEPSSRTLGVASGPSPAEIRAQNADIWNVISVSFRKHCAQGRLMDCAGHLPK